MATKSYAESISDAQVMSTGMYTNMENAEVRGWSSEKNDALVSARANAISLNDNQEKLKAELKMKTAELDTQMKELRAIMNEARKVVKLGFPQKQWKEFGITDKR